MGLGAKRQCKNHFAKASIVEVFCNDQRLREANQHAFITLWECCVGERQSHICYRNTAGTTIDHVCNGICVAIGAVERGLVEAFTSKAGNAYYISSTRKVGITCKDKNAVRSSHITIAS